jgi:hypothetical protein
MNAAGITRPPLDKARRDIEDATSALAAYWMCADDGDAIGRVANAAEALVRAISSVSLALERLAELPACEGLH